MTKEHKRRIWGWYAFDWASQPIYTLVLTFVFGPYFAAVAAQYYIGTGLDADAADAAAQGVWSQALLIVGLIIAVTAPIFGALADSIGRRMPWIIVASVVCFIGAWGLWWMVPDGSRIAQTLIYFSILMLAIEYLNVFTNSILPTLGKTEDVGSFSGNGYAIGYAGGVLALVIMFLLFVQNGSGPTYLGNPPAFGLDAEMQEGTRLVGPFSALWFAIFMVPFFWWVRDSKDPVPPNAFRNSMTELATTLKRLPTRPSLLAYLGSSMLYRDALNGLYAFGGVYAALVLEWSTPMIGAFGIIGAITAAVFTWLGGKLDRRFGPKPVIAWSCAILTVVVTIIVGMDREAIFGIALGEGSNLPDIILYGLGAIIGGIGGALQGASRTMMVHQSDPDRPTEAFGLYALSGKATAFLAPLLINRATDWLDSARLGLIPLIFLFLLGLVLLAWVKPNGDRATTWSDTPEPS